MYIYVYIVNKIEMYMHAKIYVVNDIDVPIGIIFI